MATPPTTDQIYDRQIRLWGAESQTRMMQSHVAFVNGESVREFEGVLGGTVRLVNVIFSSGSILLILSFL
jgi:hypothetical protein